jgi:hypothetical protein
MGVAFDILNDVQKVEQIMVNAVLKLVQKFERYVFTSLALKV